MKNARWPTVAIFVDGPEHSTSFEKNRTSGLEGDVITRISLRTYGQTDTGQSPLWDRVYTYTEIF